MELFDQIRKISFIFFLVIGLAHFLSGMAFVNSYFLPESGLINRVLFIPFVLCAITYVLSNIKYHLLEYGKDSKAMNIAFIAFGVVIFISLLVIELLVVDSPTPLTQTRIL